MLRNQEYRVFLIIIIFISLLAVIFTSLYTEFAVVIVAITSILLISAMLIFTNWRYRRIKQLSSYLRKISAGDYRLDVRDNHEGELSILKSDIYKVTKMLSDHQSLLQEDKIQLMDAISDISHQLKTPLTSMTVMTDLLKQDNLPQEKRIEFVHHIQTQLERIEWLVSSLLTLSKIDAGAIQFKEDPIYVKDIIDSLLDSLAIPIEIKELDININGSETASFQGDEKWTKEALLNIMKNNIEHLAEGGKISISFEENPLYTEIVIRDNGQGISKEDLPYIFKRFYRGKNANENSVGIGLAIAHQIITKQNGAIDVTSQAGIGTTFHVKLYHVHKEVVHKE
ncbi:sensor histidine kinase [Ornithinibacillus sp. 4-3]|uniref:histidine kinase n=1 Tax=Ornithinibacillus sp. 4-3 TaxID=3231488 RepID=A0AB39HPJ2_9BACI